MTQPVSARWAIDEVLLAGTIPAADFTTLLHTFHHSISSNISPHAPVFMLLEEQPGRIIEQSGREQLLCFTFFDPGFDFTPYTSGRIFHTLGELRWERVQGEIQIVYTGHKAYQPALAHAEGSPLHQHEYRDRTYLLFGKRLDGSGTPQSGEFAEVRIPRLLRYPQTPALTGAQRVQLVTREYLDSTTALNVAYRFKDLEPFYERAVKDTGAK